MINTYRESALHAGLKAWYGRAGDQFEQPIAGYIIDVVREDLLIEIQTANFAALKPKLAALLPDYAVRLVYPIAGQKWICREANDGCALSRRKSPRRGQFWDVFAELVYLPHLLQHPNLTLELLLTDQEEIWREDKKGSYRRWRRGGWRVHDRRLLEVTDQTLCRAPEDLAALLPAGLPQPFTNRDLAEALNGRLRLAQQITYTLRHCRLLNLTEKRGRALTFSFTTPDE
jgi:hypothetical protein